MKLLKLLAVLAVACLASVSGKVYLPLEEEDIKERNTDISRDQKPYLSLVVLGHADHGKTTLVSAITKVQSEKDLGRFRAYSDLDNPPDDKLKGVVISKAHVEFETETRAYDLKDIPSHDDIRKTLILGGTQFHGAIFVVSAKDGVMSQTREQLQLAKECGINNIVVFVNKADLVDDVESVKAEIRKLLKENGYDGDNTPVIVGSALKALEGKAEWKVKIDELLKAIDTDVPLPVKEKDRDFKMPVSDVFSVSGRGTIADGKIEFGVVKVGDEIQGLGLDKDFSTTVTGIEMNGRTVDEGLAGFDVGIILGAIHQNDVERGMVLAKPGAYTAHERFEAVIYVLKTAEGGRNSPFFSNYRPQIYVDTTDISGVITLLDGVYMAIPGDILSVEIDLVSPVVMEQHKTRFAIRESGRTIGIGVVTRVIE